MTGPSEVDVTQRARAAIDELALLVLDRESTQSVLQRVVDLVAAVMPAGSEVSMTVVRDDRPTTAAFTGQRALELDELQYVRGYGPCVEAAMGGHVLEISDGPAESRWPDYLPGFLAAGVLSSLAVPVPAGQLAAGLNVYAPTVGAFTEEHRQTVIRFADFAAVGLTNIDALEDARELAENLRKAMQFRSVIEQAKGILMERRKVTADEAFRLLAQASQHVNRKLRDVAEDLVVSGEFDYQPPRGPGATLRGTSVTSCEGKP